MNIWPITQRHLGFSTCLTKEQPGLPLLIINLFNVYILINVCSTGSIPDGEWIFEQCMWYVPTHYNEQFG